ncbi:uncharacterized protein TNCV_2185171 [Trichonephila clavipes]|nr:uncharacterized protein TNCV_2185171 [Trichonephila clavipes]
MPYQPRHRREIVRCCKAHVGWDQQNCSKVLFFESRLSVESGSGHRLLWREHGTLHAQKLFINGIGMAWALCHEEHFWLNGYVNKQNCRIWSEDNPQVYVETPLHPEKLTVWCALWAGGILLQKR